MKAGQKLYLGYIKGHEWLVQVHLYTEGDDGESSVATTADLALRLDLRNHSPSGFSWGYPGSGPAQTALAILADCLGDDERALRLYQDFKVVLIAWLDEDKGFAISDTVVTAIANGIDKGGRH